MLSLDPSIVSNFPSFNIKLDVRIELLLKLLTC